MTIPSHPSCRLREAYMAVERVDGLATSDPDDLLAHYILMIDLLTVWHFARDTTHQNRSIG